MKRLRITFSEYRCGRSAYTSNWPASFWQQLKTLCTILAGLIAWHRKTTCKYGTKTAPSSSKLLRDCAVGSSVRVRSETTSLLEYFLHRPHLWAHLYTGELLRWSNISCFSADANRRADGVDTGVWVCGGRPVPRICSQFFLCGLCNGLVTSILCSTG